MTRLTSDPAADEYPVWTPDGRRLAFASTREGTFNLFWRAADGTGVVERLTESTNVQLPTAVSPDGTRLLFHWFGDGVGADVGMLTLDGQADAERLFATAFNERTPEISPDGRWIAYQSDVSGRGEIYVRPFPNVDDGRWQVSASGGMKPLWGPDGRELFYLTNDGILMGVQMQTDPTLVVGRADMVSQTGYFTGGTGRNFDITPDGSRFLMIKVASLRDVDDPFEGLTRIQVVENWFEELRQRVPIP
jgi:serine/threonine-protein kinase